ncbi:MAG TPA: type VI secretion system tip protein VgrG [Kofleriaceae bacterium]|nr:type VI secretion system tip protein VgrG [Kofleriaceae bacterium]
MAATSPQVAASDLSSYLISSGGVALDGSYQVVSLKVYSALNKIPYAVIELVDGDAAAGNFTVSAGTTLAPGQPLDIQLGNEGSEQQVFSGVVTRQTIRQRGRAGAVLQVEARDHAVVMTIGRKSAVFQSTTDGDVMTQLVQGAGLDATIASTTPQLEELTQFQASDWDFLVTRAEANGQVVWVNNGAVSTFAPDPSRAAVLSLTYGLDVMEFRLDEDARTQYPSVTTSAWDPSTQALLSATSQITELNPIGTPTAAALAAVASPSVVGLQSSAALAQDRLTAWAQAAMLRSELAKVRGELKFQGSLLVQPGVTVLLNGFGARFNGTALVSGVIQQLTEGMWTTTIEIGLEEISFAERVPVSVPAATGLVPGVVGLHNGTVQQIDQDPGGQYRVQVLVSVLGAAAQGIWARLASPYASSAAGLYFFPEVGDEVILGFVAGDPGFPIVLGSLYSSSQKTPPYTPDAPNTHKAIVTKSNLQLHFDDAKKITTISTPAGNTIVVSDDQQTITITDQSSNQITMSSSGIELKSASSIKLDAQSGVTITTATGDIALSASAGKASADALNIELNAQAELNATGNATATLKASGILTIQGALVKIN